jgi:hypothetical protein
MWQRRKRFIVLGAAILIPAALFSVTLFWPESARPLTGIFRPRTKVIPESPATVDSALIHRRPASATLERQLLWQFGALLAETQATLSRRYLTLNTVLPTLSGEITTLEQQDPWHAWAASTAREAGPDVDEMIQILTEPARLDDGREIEQAFSEVGRITSAAACTTAGVRILYDPVAITGLMPPGLRFMKYHEMGHLALRHIDCDRSPKVLPNYLEKEADCWAVHRLRQLGAAGAQAIDMAAAFFRSQDDPAAGPYESSHARASYLYHRCS